MVIEMEALANAIARFPDSGRSTLGAALAPPHFTGTLDAAQAHRLTAALGVDQDGLLASLVPIAAAFARAPVSGFMVGAAARDMSDAIHFGANLEVPETSLWTSLHAEQAALATALRAGASAISAIAVSAAPCGLCRQFLLEAGAPERIAVLIGPSPPEPLAALLPQAFAPAALGGGPGLFAQSRPRISLDNVGEVEPLTAVALAAARRSHAPYTGAAAGIALRLRSGTVVDGSYVESVAHNPSLAPLAMALSQRVFGGWEDDDIVAATLVAVGHAQIDHAAVARIMLHAVAPGVRLHLRGAHRD
jgi:cytidine deaminase